MSQISLVDKCSSVPRYRHLRILISVHILTRIMVHLLYCIFFLACKPCSILHISDREYNLSIFIHCFILSSRWQTIVDSVNLWFFYVINSVSEEEQRTLNNNNTSSLLKIKRVRIAENTSFTRTLMRLISKNHHHISNTRPSLSTVTQYQL